MGHGIPTYNPYIYTFNPYLATFARSIYKIVIWLLYKVSTPCKKRPNDNLKRFTYMYQYLLLYQFLYHLTNPIGCNWISVPVLTNGLGHNLISVLGFTYPLSRRLISALVLTSHLKCQIILLILLCLAKPFFNGHRLFLFSILYHLFFVV